MTHEALIAERTLIIIHLITGGTHGTSNTEGRVLREDLNLSTPQKIPCVSSVLFYFSLDSSELAASIERRTSGLELDMKK